MGESVFSQLLRYVFVLEPFAPPAISYYLRRRLREWKQQGLILDYKVRTKRLAKFHYKTQIDLDVSPEQMVHALDDLFSNRLKRVRRWLNG